MDHSLSKPGDNISGETRIFSPEDDDGLDRFIENNIVCRISKKSIESSDNNLSVYSAVDYEGEDTYTSYGIIKERKDSSNTIMIDKREFKSLVKSDVFSKGLKKIIRCYYNQTYIDFIFSSSNKLIKAKVYKDEIPDWCEDLRVS